MKLYVKQTPGPEHKSYKHRKPQSDKGARTVSDEVSQRPTLEAESCNARCVALGDALALLHGALKAPGVALLQLAQVQLKRGVRPLQALLNLYADTPRQPGIKHTHCQPIRSGFPEVS